ncbi:hypothetical protein BMF94_0761 [Rhodotorula taiwanensis]|uniref:F-box domain-containing protein n=1 Tax=Rhodotorula taiwanensis TaxID=741276 RepID=A0A2S5BGY1_9BASI|nr:hypothetical protein BMF94_0761 [Rhodotorula taiwanensis]
MDDSHGVCAAEQNSPPAPEPAALRLPDKILTKIFASVLEYRHAYARSPQHRQLAVLLIKCLTLSKRFYNIVLPVWLGDSKLDLCTERGHEALQRLMLPGSCELIEALEVKFDWTQASNDMASLTAFQNVRELKIDFGPSVPKDRLGRISLPPGLKDVIATLPLLETVLFYPPVLVPREWAPALSNLREFNSDYISLNADLQWCLTKSRMSNLLLVADGAKNAISRGSEIGLIPWGPALKQLTFGVTPSVGRDDLNLAIRHCFRATRLLSDRPTLSRLWVRIMRRDNFRPDDAVQLGLALADLCNCPEVYIECHATLMFTRVNDTPDEFLSVQSLTLYAAVLLYEQSNFASFLAFLKRLPNLKKLDIGFFFFSASQMPHSIESMSTRQLARNFPSLFSLPHCLIDTSLRVVVKNVGFRYSAARGQVPRRHV